MPQITIQNQISDSRASVRYLHDAAITIQNQVSDPIDRVGYLPDAANYNGPAQKHGKTRVVAPGAGRKNMVKRVSSHQGPAEKHGKTHVVAPGAGRKRW